MEIQYFGTNLREAGHYRWKLTSDYFSGGTIYFKDLPFNPEYLNNGSGHQEKGTVTYWWTGGYSICRIEGSCKDNRPGSKSVFWVRQHLTGGAEGELKAAILANPLGRQIIEALPFTVNW